MNHLNYAKPPDSIHRAIAALRYSGYEISGSGPIAVVLHCCRKIVLCAIPLAAHAIKGERCSQVCSAQIAPEGSWHVIEPLDILPQQRPAIRRNIRDLIERD